MEMAVFLCIALFRVIMFFIIRTFRRRSPSCKDLYFLTFRAQTISQESVSNAK